MMESDACGLHIDGVNSTTSCFEEELHPTTVHGQGGRAKTGWHTAVSVPEWMMLRIGAWTSIETRTQALRCLDWNWNVMEKGSFRVVHLRVFDLPPGAGHDGCADHFFSPIILTLPQQEATLST